MTNEMCRFVAQRSRLLFSPKEEATILNNVVDKNRICYCENVCNVVIITCSLLVGVNCIAYKSKLELNSNLLEWKTFYLYSI